MFYLNFTPEFSTSTRLRIYLLSCILYKLIAYCMIYLHLFCMTELIESGKLFELEICVL